MATQSALHNKPTPTKVTFREWLRTPKVQSHVMGYLFLLPALLVMGTFVFYPIIRGLPLAFTDYSAIGETHWVGLKWFKYAFTDESWQKAYLHSIEYLLVVPIIQFLAILMALLVNRKLRGVGIFRTAYYVPVVTSMVAVAITWQWIYDPRGILNWLLGALHLIDEPVTWLSNPKTVFPSIMAVTIWKGLGYYMVIYLAGLQSIPKELEEAAAIDGCGKWGIIRHITLPLLKPFILVASIVSCQAALHVFEEVFVMVGPTGGPNGAALVNGVYNYTIAFQKFELGRGAALNLLAAPISWVLTILLFRYYRDKGAGQHA